MHYPGLVLQVEDDLPKEIEKNKHKKKRKLEEVTPYDDDGERKRPHKKSKKRELQDTSDEKDGNDEGDKVDEAYEEEMRKIKKKIKKSEPKWEARCERDFPLWPELYALNEEQENLLYDKGHGVCIAPQAVRVDRKKEKELKPLVESDEVVVRGGKEWTWNREYNFRQLSGIVENKLKHLHKGHMFLKKRQKLREFLKKYNNEMAEKQQEIIIDETISTWILNHLTRTEASTDIYTVFLTLCNVNCFYTPDLNESLDEILKCLACGYYYITVNVKMANAGFELHYNSVQDCRKVETLQFEFVKGTKLRCTRSTRLPAGVAFTEKSLSSIKKMLQHLQNTHVLVQPLLFDDSRKSKHKKEKKKDE